MFGSFWLGFEGEMGRGLRWVFELFGKRRTSSSPPEEKKKTQRSRRKKKHSQTDPKFLVVSTSRPYTHILHTYRNPAFSSKD